MLRLPRLPFLRHRGERVVPVRTLWRAHDRYIDRRVTTRGVVQRFAPDTPDEYYTLDDGPNRIGLRGAAAMLYFSVGQPVQVSGTLTFKSGVGIFLNVETIAPG